MARAPALPRPGLLARLRLDRRGVAAIEFALIAPVMILMYFGVAELCTVMMADRRTGHADSAIGDLAAQYDKLYDGQIADIFTVSSTVLAPFDPADLQLRLTSVTVNSSGVAQVDWSDVKSDAQADLPKLACNSNVTTLPNNVATNPGDTVLMAEAVYSYTSPIGYNLKRAFKFTPRYFTRPRLSAKVGRFVGGPSSTTPACP